MQSVPDKFFSLAIPDPPYGRNNLKKNKHSSTNPNNYTYKNDDMPNELYYKELFRVSKTQLIWGGQYQYHILPAGGSFHVWDKGAEPDLHHMSACDIVWYSKPHRIERIRLNWCGAVKCEKDKIIHIHQKPVEVYKWLLQRFAKPGDIIFDSHMGSQSSRIAAYELGFDYYGCELDKDYFREGCARFEAYRKQKEEIAELGYAKSKLEETNPTLFN